MSTIANKRKLAEAVSVLVHRAAPTPQQLKDVYVALAQVTTDLTGDDCKIILQFGSDPAVTIGEGATP